MSNTFSLDDIRDAANRKYANRTIPFGDGRSVTLVNALQLSKDKRTELFSVNKGLGEEDADQVALLENALRIAANGDDATEDFIKDIDGNLAVLLGVFEHYNKETEAGEA